MNDTEIPEAIPDKWELSEDRVETIKKALNTLIWEEGPPDMTLADAEAASLAAMSAICDAFNREKEGGT